MESGGGLLWEGDAAPNGRTKLDGQPGGPRPRTPVERGGPRACGSRSGAHRYGTPTTRGSLRAPPASTERSSGRLKSEPPLDVSTPRRSDAPLKARAPGRVRNVIGPAFLLGGSVSSPAPSVRCSARLLHDLHLCRLQEAVRGLFLQVSGTGGGSSVGQSRGLIILRSQVRVLPAPPRTRRSEHLRELRHVGRSAESPHRIRRQTGLQSVERLREGVQLVVEQVPVAVQCEGLGAMSELSPYGLDRAPGTDRNLLRPVRADRGAVRVAQGRRVSMFNPWRRG